MQVEVQLEEVDALDRMESPHQHSSPYSRPPKVYPAFAQVVMQVAVVRDWSLLSKLVERVRVFPSV